jgi:PTS system ascorbate-specific IIA component
MIGILIISHDQLGTNLIDCAIHILGECPPQLMNHVISYDADPNTEVITLQARLKQLDEGDGILILTDILGATPANIASKLVQSGHVECIAGLNLPMLLRAIQYQHTPLSQLVEKVLTGGRKSILQISQKTDHAN